MTEQDRAKTIFLVVLASIGLCTGAIVYRVFKAKTNGSSIFTSDDFNKDELEDILKGAELAKDKTSTKAETSTIWTRKLYTKRITSTPSTETKKLEISTNLTTESTTVIKTTSLNTTTTVYSTTVLTKGQKTK